MKNTANFPWLVKTAVLAAAFSLPVAALAEGKQADPAPAATQTAGTATQPAAQAVGPHARFAVRGEHRRSAMQVPGYGVLSGSAVKALGLNEAQSKLLTEAQAMQKEARKSRYQSSKAGRNAKFEQLKASKVDPRAALKQAEADRSAAGAERAQITEKWLAVWDSLDAAQQQKAATLLSERLARRGGHHMKHRHHAGNGPHHLQSAAGGAASAS